MLEWIFSTIFHFFANNFEILFPIVFALFIVVVLLVVSLKLQDVSLHKLFYLTLRNVLLMGVIMGELLLMGITVYVYWVNYEKPEIAFKIPEDVLPTTQWVKQDLKIYFVDGKELFSIQINGQNKQKILTANEEIKEYYLSPDGKNILVATRQGIYYWNQGNQENIFIDGIQESDNTSNMKAAISGIRWAPDNRKFCYELSKWSDYSSQNYLYVYDIDKKQKIAIQTPSRQISFLYWDKQSENLYYVQHDVKNNEKYAYRYEVKVFQIMLKEVLETKQVRNPKLVTVIPFDSQKMPVENLKLRGIDLFIEGDNLIFDAASQRSSLISEKGSFVGIDENDYLYFVRNKWFRKRLFKISRLPVIKDNVFQHQYKGGELTIKKIRWLPGGQYIIMEHRYLGVFILEPSSGKVGLLIGVTGDTIGWYQEVLKFR